MKNTIVFIGVALYFSFLNLVCEYCENKIGFSYLVIINIYFAK